MNKVDNKVQNKVVVKTKDENDNDIELSVVRPTPKQLRQAQIVYSKSVRNNIENGAILRIRLEEYLREQGVWSDVKQKEKEKLEKEILEATRLIKRGGSENLTKSKGKELALKIKNARFRLRDLISSFSALDNISAEGLADNERFSYLVSVCTLRNNNGNPYYSSLEDYYDRGNEDAASDCAEKLANLLYGIDDNKEKDLPENQFLLKYGYVNDKLQPIDKEGKLVDWEGRPINESGRYINSENKFCDIDGNLVDESGEIIEEFVEFLDD